MNSGARHEWFDMARAEVIGALLDRQSRKQRLFHSQKDALVGCSDRPFRL
jgi:hypothetical protein